MGTVAIASFYKHNVLGQTLLELSAFTSFMLVTDLSESKLLFTSKPSREAPP